MLNPHLDNVQPQRLQLGHRLPGVMAACLIALSSIGLSRFISGPGDVFFAIMIGLLGGNLLPRFRSIAPGIDFAEKKLLPAAIALMGTELQLHALGQLGLSAVAIVIPSMVLPIICALWIGRMLGFSVPASLVLGIGNSICGSSAVLATAPAVNAEKHDTAVAIASVNLLGTIGIFLIPGLAVLLALPDVKTSYLIGGSLQAVGQVAAAGYSVSNSVGENSLLVKMLRVLMLGPTVMILHAFFKSRGNGTGKRAIPPYLIGFVVFAVLANGFQTDVSMIARVHQLANFLLVIAMGAVAYRIQVRSLTTQAPRALLMVMSLSLIQISCLLLLIRWFT